MAYSYRLPCLFRSRGSLPCTTTYLSKTPQAVTTLSTTCVVSVMSSRWYNVNRPQETQGLSTQCLANGRYASTKAVEEGLEGSGDSVQHMPLFKRFWRWLHDLDDLERWDNPPDSETQAELDEREVFLNRVQAMYFADPPQKPDLQFCRESLEMLMKYNDRVAVETLWNILSELKVEPDEELKTRVLLYLKKAKLEAYYE